MVDSVKSFEVFLEGSPRVGGGGGWTLLTGRYFF